MAHSSKRNRQGPIDEDPEVHVFRRDFAAERAAGLVNPTMDELNAFYDAARCARIREADVPY